MINEKQSEMTPEIRAILDVGKAELLALKMENQKVERDLAQKRRAEQEANRIRQEKKVQAAQNAKLAKRKNAIKVLDASGYKNYKLDEVFDDLECMQVSSNRSYQFLIDKNGKVLISGDWIHYGDKGFLYVQDTFKNICTLCHYDRETGTIETFAPLSSELELLKELEKIDPGRKFGFINLYPDYCFKEPETSGNKKIKTESQLGLEKRVKKNPFTEEEFDDLFK
jgi:hypothetical protein